MRFKNLHGLVKPLCKVGRGVPDAFHWEKRAGFDRLAMSEPCLKDITFMQM